MMNSRALLIISALVFATACDRPDDTSATAVPQGDNERVAVIGAAVTRSLTESLGTELRKAIAAGGPVAAIPVCQQIALPLTDAAGKSFDGVTVRRTTLKPRNPANAASDRDRAVLELMATQPAPGVVIQWEGDIAHYYQPLIVQEICLKCHGDPASFPRDLSKALELAYPDDAATGYAAGDLRGAIHVTVSAP